MTTAAAGVDGEALAFGGRIRLAYGVTDNLDVSLGASFARAQAIEFRDAEIDGQRGRLFADDMAMDVSLGFRWNLGVEMWRLLERTRPFVGARGGALLQAFSGQVLLNPENKVLLEPDSALSVRPFVAGEAGIERRFGDHLFIGLTFEVAYGKDYRHLGGCLALAWSWY